MPGREEKHGPHGKDSQFGCDSAFPSIGSHWPDSDGLNVIGAVSLTLAFWECKNDSYIVFCTV